MIFSTYWFIVASALFLPLYWFARWPKVRLTLLLLFCFIFHCHFAGPAGVLPIIVLATITFLIGRSRNTNACAAGIVLCVAALAFYKYTHFALNQFFKHFAPVLSQNIDQSSSLLLPVLPPLAISFFTFEFVHYLFEVRKGGEPITNPVEFAQFTFYFPSLVAGPIKRYSQFIPSLREGLKTVSKHDIAMGMLLVASGFFKKAVVADNLTQYVDFWGTRLHFEPMMDRWVFVAALAIRIYMDFSGYSDMAIGFSRMMGITLPKNFNWPYLARNMQDFWQRWHISLSTWIRDYVYIPLGGSRHGMARRVANGLIAFSLCGLWHGAAWHFVIWGLWHGAGLSICSSYRKVLGPVGTVLGMIFDRLPVLSWALTMSYVGFGWLLFFYPLDQAWQITKLLFVRA